MNISLRYFWYHFKETIYRLCLISGIGFIVGYITATAVSFSGRKEMQHVSYFGAGGIIFFSIIFSMIVPIVEFARFRSRRNLDLWFSMPIKRTNLAFAHLANGAIEVVGGMIAMILPVWFVFWVNGAPLGDVFLLFLGGTFFVLCLYAFNSFLAASSSRVFESVFLIVGYMFLGFASLFILDQFRFNINVTDSLANNIFGFSNISTFMDGLAKKISYGPSEVESVPWYYYWISVVQLASIAGLYLRFKFSNTESFTDTSDLPYGFNFLIPFYFVFAAPFFGSGGFILVVILLTLAFLVKLIQRKGIHFKKIDIITLGVLTAYSFFMLFYPSICTAIDESRISKIDFEYISPDDAEDLFKDAGLKSHKNVSVRESAKDKTYSRRTRQMCLLDTSLRSASGEVEEIYCAFEKNGIYQRFYYFDFETEEMAEYFFETFDYSFNTGSYSNPSYYVSHDDPQYFISNGDRGYTDVGHNFAIYMKDTMVIYIYNDDVSPAAAGLKKLAHSFGVIAPQELTRNDGKFNENTIKAYSSLNEISSYVMVNTSFPVEIVNTADNTRGITIVLSGITTPSQAQEVVEVIEDYFYVKGRDDPSSRALHRDYHIYMYGDKIDFVRFSAESTANAGDIEMRESEILHYINVYDEP